MIIAAGALIAPLQVSAQSELGPVVTIYDEPNCPGGGSTTKVSAPFSMGVTGLAPFSQNRMNVSSETAKREVLYGPVIITADLHGNACLNVLSAPQGSWHFTVSDHQGFDGKDFTIGGPIAPTTSLATTTTTTTSTTLPGTTAPVTTVAVPDQVFLPVRELPWVFERRPVDGLPPIDTASTAGPVSLPRSGSSAPARLTGLGLWLLAVGGVAGSGHAPSCTRPLLTGYRCCQPFSSRGRPRVEAGAHPY